GQFLLLDDEVNPVLNVVLNAGLDVTGLAASCSFERSDLHTIDENGTQPYRGCLQSPRLRSGARRRWPRRSSNHRVRTCRGEGEVNAVAANAAYFRGPERAAI